MTPASGTAEGRRPLLFRAQSLSGSLGVYLPATVASRCLGLVRGVVLAWLITESEFGLLQVAFLTIGILQPFCSAGLYEALTRYVPQHETRGRLQPFLARVVPVTVGLAAALCAVVCLAARPIGVFAFATLQGGEQPGLDEAACVALMRLAAALTFALIVYFVVISILKGMRMFRAVSVIEIVTNAVFTAATIIVALYGWQTAGAVLLCYTLTLCGAVVLSSPALVSAVRRASGAAGPAAGDAADVRSRPLVEQMLRFGSWAALAAVTWQALQSYPMWHLHKMCGQHGEVTAVFAGIRLLAQAVLIGAVAVVNVVQTSVTKTWESQGPAAADRQLLLAFKSTGLGLLLACTAMVAGAQWLVRMLPAGYAPGAAIMPPLLIFFLVGGHLSFLAIHFSLIEKTRYMFWPWLAGVMCNVCFGIWLVRPGMAPEVALRAAAWAGVLGISAALMVSLLLVRSARRPVDAGSWVLLAATGALVLPAHWLAAAVGVLVIAALATNVILTGEEKRQIRQKMLAVGQRMRMLRAVKTE